MYSILQDLRYGLRQLRKSPSFTLTAILTLAFGIGASTALFSVVDAVLLKPLAYRDSGHLVAIWERVRFLEKLFPYVGPNPRHFDTWQKQATAFTDLTLLQQNTIGVSIGSNDHPQLVGRILGQPNLLDVLGVQPILGRSFLAEEGTGGHQRVIIISSHLWQTLFHNDPKVIGKTIQLAGDPYQIVGVLPKSFHFPRANELTDVTRAQRPPESEVITPLFIDLKVFGYDGDYGNYVALGHLKPDTSISQAQQNLNLITNNILRQVPSNLAVNAPGSLSIYVQPLKQAITGQAATRLWLLMAAVLSVLLIACINLANAQLARFVRRDREAALRSALGASPAYLLQSALVEILILTAAGGILGIALAVFAVHRFSGYAQFALPRAGAISINYTVLAVSILLTAGSAILFGVLPALRVLRIRPQQALQNGGRSTGSRHSGRLARVLIAAQIFACTTLLLVAGLFTKSLIRLSTSDKGFSTDHIVAADVLLQGKIFDDYKVRNAFDDGVLQKLRSIPSVQSASLVSYMLLEGGSWIDGIVPVGSTANENELANYRWISPDYFATLGQSMLEGRALDEHDRDTNNAVISERTAKAVSPEHSPVGRKFLRNAQEFTVVGVVRDAHNNSLRSAPANMVYFPYWKNPPQLTYFLVHGTQDPELLIDSVRKAIWSYNPSVTISRVYTLNDQLSDSLAPEHLETGIILAFAAAALLLALLGIYGTLSYSVEARTQEVGIRMALGSTRPGIYLLMLGSIVTPVVIGLAAGCIVSQSIGKSLKSLLYETAPTDPTIIAFVIALFAIASILATYLPCRRAAMTEPMDALKTE